MSQTRRRTKPTRGAPWPLILGLLGGLLVLGAIVLLPRRQPRVAVEVLGSPSLRADRLEIDLGDVRLGTTVEVAFQLSNVGDQPLRFAEPPYIEVREGC
jgi:hypothetical protein